MGFLTILLTIFFFAYSDSSKKKYFSEDSIRHEAPQRDMSRGNAEFSAMPNPASAGEGLHKNAVFMPAMPLKPQLSALKEAADEGDAKAACVLATAQDFCGRTMNNLPVMEYPQSYLSALNDAQFEKFMRSVAMRETRAANLCADIRPEDLLDVNERLLNSALLGNTKAMTRFALLPALPDGISVASKERLAMAYRGNAESLLNRAASFGDIEAIANVASAYAAGNITSAMGDLSVKVDSVKSAAASRAMARISEDLAKKQMPSFYDSHDLPQEGIQWLMQGMSQAELLRLEKLESVYYNAYWLRSKDGRLDRDPLDDLPEFACESGPR